MSGQGKSAADLPHDPADGQYGDLFSFKMMGRTMTVALGPKGNNLSLGGKVSQVSAEEAYTVSHREAESERKY